MIQRMVSILPCLLQRFHRFGQDIPPKHPNWQPQVLRSRQAECSLKRLIHMCTLSGSHYPKEFRSQSLDRMFLSSKATWSLHSCALSVSMQNQPVLSILMLHVRSKHNSKHSGKQRGHKMAQCALATYGMLWSLHLYLPTIQYLYSV